MSSKTPFIQFNFEKIRETGWPVIIGFIIAIAGFTSVVNLIVFPADVFRPVADVTAGLIQSTLIVNLIGLVIIVIGIIIFAGRLKGKDVGIIWPLIPKALVVTIGLWFATQIIGLVINIISGRGLGLDSMWQNTRLTVVIGSIIAQIFGNALLEEIEYRGFLLPQIFLKLNSRKFVLRRNYRIAAALVISQVVFSLSHIPNRLFLGEHFSEWPLDFFTLLGIGVLYGLIYLRTGNIFIAVGVHALANIPASLFISQNAAGNIILALGIVLLFLWRPVSRLLHFLDNPSVSEV